MDTNNLQTVWPGWETVRLIGKGSFGAVYEIRRQVFGETESAALKVITIPQSSSEIEDLRSDGYDDRSITARFESYLKDIIREYSMMSRLKGCANVVYCDDVKYIQHDDGFGWDIFIKMELLTPLNRCLGPTIPEEQVLRVAKDMCRALAVCEEQHVLHRDIKPQNIFVARDGTCKLGDFGVAKTVERTSGGTKAGTYKYMAPEIYNNQPYGAKADQYSLGMVLYLLMNRRRTPFLSSPPQIPTAQQEEEARERRFRGEVIPPPVDGSPALQRIVLRMLSFDPQQRYPNAAAILRDLEALGAVRSESPVISEEPEEPVAEKPPAFGAVSTAFPAFLPDDGATMGAFSSSDPRRQAAPSLRPAPVPKDPESPPPPPPKEAVIHQSKSRRGLIFGLCGAVALGLILLLLLLPKNRNSQPAPAATPGAVTETTVPKPGGEPTPEAVPESTPSPEELLAQGYVQLNDGVFWKLEDGVLTIAGSGDMADFFFDQLPWHDSRDRITTLVIENGITSVGTWMCSRCENLTSVSIPDSVTRIGNFGFEFCKNLAHITIPDSVTSIGDSAFWACESLNALVIPASVTEIGEGAFTCCRNLTSLTIPSSVSNIEGNAFAGCDMLSSITVQDGNNHYLAKDNVLFSKDMKSLICYPAGRSGTSYAIPSGITLVASEAFRGCHLSSVTLPEGITEIGNAAFTFSDLESITLPAGMTKIDDGAFWGCPSLKSITIPESITSIGSYCCRDCLYFRDVYYTGSEEQWKAVSFGENNDELFSATIHFGKANPAPTVNAQDYMNQGYTQMSDTTFWKLEDGVLTIAGAGDTPDWASREDAPWYERRETITGAVVEDGITGLGNWLFNNCANMRSVSLPGGISWIGNEVFGGCYALEEVLLPEGLTSIGSYVFYHCRSIRSLTIPSTVAEIGTGVFLDCPKLSAFTVAPGNAHYRAIDGVLFTADMDTLLAFPIAKTNSSYSIPNGVSHIASYAFFDNSLLMITFPDSCTKLDIWSIGDSDNLQTVSLPGGLAEIRKGAFLRCHNLKDVYFRGSEAQWKVLSIGEQNEDLTSAAIHYNAS